MTTVEKYEKYTLPMFGKRTFEAVSGKGCVLTGADGRKYLDFGAGIAVNSLGHANARWVKAVATQAATLAHCSNLYLTKPHADLAEKLVGLIGKGKVFFCNSGTEANEALLKAARLHGVKVAGKEGVKYRVVTAVDSFHGRTLGSVAATAQDKIQHNFSPILDGFSYAKFNDLESFQKQMGDDVAAVLVEPVQGESGVTPATKEFLKGLKALCKKHNALLFFDEIQCGVGRTGAFLACQRYGVKPDGVSMAKGIAGGFPMGAIWLDDKCSDLFTAGSHGTTFGGNPLACAAALATLEEFDRKGLVENAKKTGELLAKGLEKIAKKYPSKIACVRGLGLMRAAVFKPEYVNKAVCDKLRENGLLLIPAGANALRFLPPLIVKPAEVEKALKIFEKTISQL